MTRLLNSLIAYASPRENLFVCLIIATFITINFSVACRTPTVYVDEPGYTDPAANYCLGEGFTSTMWGQDRHAFWAGNVPLYEIILVCFFKVFGFGLFQARSVNTLLAAYAGFIIWGVLKHRGLIATAPYRLLSLILLLSGSVSTLTIRTIRPDTTMFAVCATVFLAWSIRSEKLRLIAVFLSSSLLIPSGLSMLPYATIMLVLYLIVFGFGFIKTVAAAFAGVIGGVGWLYLLYSHFSSFQTFLNIVLPSTVVKSGGSSFTSAMASRIFGDGKGSDRPDSIFTCFFGNPLDLITPPTLFDYSSALLFFLMLWVAFLNRASLTSLERKVLLFAVLMVLVVPPSLHFAAHYRAMYRWMTYMPLCVLAPCFVESVSGTSKIMIWRQVAAGIFAVAILLGVPLRTIFIIPSWSERSVNPIDSAVERVANKSDVVVCNMKIYFAVRPLVKTVFATDLVARGTFDQIKNLPTSEITLLCLRPGDPKEFDMITSIVGGKWQRVASGTPKEETELERTRYDVNFYRRVVNPNSQ